MESLSKELLRYGEITSNIDCNESDGVRTIKTIRYNGKCYYHHMFNGEIVEIFEI